MGILQLIIYLNNQYGSYLKEIYIPENHEANQNQINTIEEIGKK